MRPSEYIQQVASLPEGAEAQAEDGMPTLAFMPGPNLNRPPRVQDFYPQPGGQPAPYYDRSQPVRTPGGDMGTGEREWSEFTRKVMRALGITWQEAQAWIYEQLYYTGESPVDLTQVPDILMSVLSSERKAASKTAAGTRTLYRALVLDLGEGHSDQALVGRIRSALSSGSKGSWTHWTWDLDFAENFAFELAYSGYDEHGKWREDVTRFIIQAEVNEADIEHDEEVIMGLSGGFHGIEPEVVLKPGSRVQMKSVIILDWTPPSMRRKTFPLNMSVVAGTQKAATSWRGLTHSHFWLDYDVVITSEGGAAGRKRYEVYVDGRIIATRPTLAEAKAAVESRYGELQWGIKRLQPFEVDHRYFGPTDEFTSPTTIWIASLR